MRRRGFSDETIRALRQCYRAVFFESDAKFDEALERAKQEFQGSVESARFLAFLADARSSDRGFLRPRNDDNGSSDEE
jgi:acyl-[acyl carrier protein]--UDP-N-acetylglucosamine O-acyltransferase